MPESSIISHQPPILMAAKKTASKTTDSPTPSPAEKAPVAKKTAKKAAKKAATKAAKELPTATPSAVPVAPKTVAKPSSDAIARAAYLIYRRRVEQGLPGDSHSDWLEAERQLSAH